MRSAFVFLTIIFIANLVGMYFGAYNYWWFDMTLHFLGGFFMGMFMWQYLKDSLPKNKLKTILVVVGAVSFIGIIWEFTEYLASQTLIEPLYNRFGFRTYFIGDLDDTINDLLMDVLGSFAISLIAILMMPAPKSSPKYLHQEQRDFS